MHGLTRILSSNYPIYLQNMATLSESYLSEKLTESLHTVKNIKLINHGISAVGDLKACKELEKADLSKNEIQDASGLAKCSNLTWLNVSNNKLKSLEFVKKLKKITVLTCGNNMINDISPLSRLRELKALILNNNCLHQVTGLENFQSLNTLVLSHNSIEEIDVTLLNSLTKLQLSHNKIRCFPDIKFNSELTSLSLNDNLIEKVSGDHVASCRLERLDLGKNKIRKLKHIQSLTRLSKLKNLNLMGNELKPGYQEVVKQMFPSLQLCDTKPVMKKENSAEKTADTQSSTESEDDSPKKKRKRSAEDKTRKTKAQKQTHPTAKTECLPTSKSTANVAQLEPELGNTAITPDVPKSTSADQDSPLKNKLSKSQKQKKSGVVAIKNIKKTQKQKHEKEDIFTTFQTDIGSGSLCAW